MSFRVDSAIGIAGIPAVNAQRSRPAILSRSNMTNENFPKTY
jgi:hypothetical protein